MPDPDATRILSLAAPPIPSGVTKPIEGLARALPIPSGQPVAALDTQVLIAAAESKGVFSSPWFWLLAAAVLVAATVFGVWWWWRKSGAAPPKLPAEASLLPVLDPDRDFSRFRSSLPAALARALDDFQPIFVLGSNASNKELLVSKLSGFKERRFPKKMSFEGKSIGIYLGATSLVLVPTDEFLRAPAPEENAGWGKLVRRVCRTRPPRILVCLAQSPIDSGAVEEITNWASTLRSQIDFVAATRNEAIDVSVVVAQTSITVAEGTVGLTDALFNLLSAVGARDGWKDTHRISLEGLSQLLPFDSEERRQVASNWTATRLQSCLRAWPTLLAHSDWRMSFVLQHSELFDNFERLTTGLGASLAELFANDPLGHPRVRGVELRLLPHEEDALSRAVELMAADKAISTQWRPSRTVWHRLVAATMVSVVIGTMWLCYADSLDEWDDVARVAIGYVPPSGEGKLAAVQDYALKVAEHADASASREVPWLIQLGRLFKSLVYKIYVSFTFFDRDLPRCIVLKSARDYLEDKLRTAVRVKDAPERVLQLGALYLAGDPSDCNKTPQDKIEQYDQLMHVIENHSEQWRPLTGLSQGDLKAYLALACPLREVSTLENILRTYDWSEQDKKHWPALPEAERVAKALQSLSGECSLSRDERDAIRTIRESVGSLDGATVECGAANEVFRRMQVLGAPAPALAPLKAAEQQARFKALEELSSARESLDLIAKDIRAFALADAAQASTLGRSIGAFNELLDSQLSHDLPSGEVPVVQLTLGNDTYVVDRRKARRSLMFDSLEQFVRAAPARDGYAGTKEAALFGATQFRREYVWLPASAIPTGISLQNVVPWRYSIDGFDAGITKPLDRMTSLAGRVTCLVDKGSDAASQFDKVLTHFVDEHMADYLAAYRAEWSKVYRSFRLEARDESTLVEALLGLTGKKSSQLSMMQEVLRQTRLSMDAKAPSARAVATVADDFESLSAALDEKTFGEYQGLLLEIASAGQDKKGDAALAAPPGSKSDDAVETFVQDLSGLARIVANGARDPKQDVRTRVRAWVNKAKIAPKLAEAFMQPVEAAYGTGWQSLENGFRKFWSTKSDAMKDITEAFPFKRSSERDAGINDVIAWLEPNKGRFFAEVAPVCDWMNSLGKAWRRNPDADAMNAVARMKALSRLLFKPSGEPSSIRVKCEPVPFDGSLVTASALALDDRLERYFNTQPRTMELLVPWNVQYVASVRIDLVGDDGDGSKVAQVAAALSPWSFFHLLELGNAKPSVVTKNAGSGSSPAMQFTWGVRASTGRADQLPPSVSYRVCPDPRQCDGLFTREVLQWN